MKIGILGDLHIAGKAPRKRKDDYFKTQLLKLEEALCIFQLHKCDFVIQAGDFFDTPTVGNYVISEVIKLLSEFKFKIYCVYGQHDISGHSELTYYRSPLNVLESAGCVTLLNSKPKYEESAYPVALLGASFGLEIPETNTELYKVLVTHRMIGDRPLYDGQELEYPNEFMSRYNYDLCVVGDYHYAFDYKFGNKVIINAGCMMRKSVGKNDLEHKPKVVVFDTISLEAKSVYLQTALPIEQVFDLSVDIDKSNLQIEDFVNSLFEDSNNSIDWKRELYNAFKERNVNESIVSEIEDSLKNVEVANG